MEEHHKYNAQNINEIPNPNDQPLPMMQYPVSLYPIMSQDVEIQPPIYSSNMLPPKTISSVETNGNWASFVHWGVFFFQEIEDFFVISDMGNPMRVFYNNNVDVSMKIFAIFGQNFEIFIFFFPFSIIDTVFLQFLIT